MEKRYNQIAREEYIDQLVKSGKSDKAYDISSKDLYEPILTPVEFHGESEIKSEDINDILEHVKKDIRIINEEVIYGAESIKGLMESTRIKLNSIKSILSAERERQEDLNILCNKYTDFSNAIFISDNYTGNVSYTDKVLHLEEISSKTVPATVVEVSGNGYEGNKYVLSKGIFISEVSDTSKREYMVDGSLISYYEYSRITANNNEKVTFSQVNFDSIMARCSIIISGKETFNMIDVKSMDEGVILESISTSSDGHDFSQATIVNVPLNSKQSRFNSDSYIYGSGILSFKDCKFVKIVLKSNINTTEDIAFSKKNSDNTENIVELESAKRSVIRINDIAVYRKEYATSGKLRFNSFINTPATSLAIFANEYISDELDIRECVKYTLTVNGLDYDIVPINSNTNGKKIIRTTSKTIPADHVHYLNETAKDATLTIDFLSNKSHSSPFVSDLKILVGEDK